MTPSAALRWFGITTFVLAVAGSATAQSATPALIPPPDGQIGFQHNASLSPQEMIAEGTAAVTRMQNASGTVGRQLTQARGARDVVKTLCLNDKLSQIDVTTRSAQDRLSALQSAVARGDIEGAHHHFSILTAHRQHAEQVTAEANQCIGEEIAFVGATTTTTEIDNDIVNEAVTDLNDTTVIVGVPPPPSSVSPTK
jgi:hypothetical protein